MSDLINEYALQKFRTADLEIIYYYFVQRQNISKKEQHTCSMKELMFVVTQTGKWFVCAKEDSLVLNDGAIYQIYVEVKRNMSKFIS